MSTAKTRFVKSAKRLAAVDLAQAGDANAWNGWRQEADLFGDHHRNRINLAEVDLRSSNLSKYNLTNVSFYRTNLSHSNLVNSDCAYSDFHEANLIGSDFSGANLRHARLSRTYLRGAKLDRADLRNCDLRRASVRSASFLGADLRGVDLSNTRGLDQEQLIDAIGDRRTRLPSHLVMPATWDDFDHEAERDDDDLSDLRIVPATVEVAVISGVVQLTRHPGDAYFSSSADPAVLKSEILSDLLEVTPRLGNFPSLSRAINLYIEELNKDDYDVIIVGTRAIRLESIFKSIMDSNESDGPSLLPDAVGMMRAILIQHYLFVGQSHRWKSFLEEAALAPYTSEGHAVARDASEKVVAILQAHTDVCEPRVPTAIESVAEEIEISDDNQKLSIYNAIASIENVFRSIVTWLVKEARRLLGDSWEQFRSKLATILGGGMAILVSHLLLSDVAQFLATKYPDRFAWLNHAAQWIRDLGS